jgi:hypothetical protein
MLLATCWFTALSVAQADVDPPGYREAVEGAIAEFSAGNYPEAQTLFQRAHGILPNARTLRGLGVVAFEQRSYTESARLLEAALASKERHLEGELRRDTEGALARARMFIGQLELTLSPPEAEVLVDGEAVHVRPGEPLTLDVGTHTLAFHANGHRPQERKLQVQGMKRLAWRVELQPLHTAEERTGEKQGQPSGSEAHPGSDKPGSGLVLAKWLTAAGTLAASGTMVSALMMREQRAREVDDCGVDLDCSNSERSGTRWKHAAIATGSVAGALLIATVALFVADGRHTRTLAQGCSIEMQTRGVGCWTSF